MKTILSCFAVTIFLFSFGQTKIESLYGNNPDYEPYKNWIDSSYMDCMQSWETNLEWGDCIGEHTGKWMSFMDQSYDSLMTLLDPAGQEILKASQIAWHNNNLAQLEFWNYFNVVNEGYFGREGHFGASMVDLDIIRNRAIELHHYLNVFQENK